MKLLTQEEIDFHAARVICNDHDWQAHLEVIIAQAKLACSIQQRAAEICLEKAEALRVTKDAAYAGYEEIMDCHDAILNMEVQE